MIQNNNYKVSLNTQTLFLLSTSGSQGSIEKHNGALQEMGINVAYFTFGRKITPKVYANLLRSPIVRGGAVTGQGLKSGIIPFLDDVDQLAKKINSVNTVVNKEGKLYGYNTDTFGFLEALNQHIKRLDLKIERAVIYGNGGVSGVAAHALRSMGIKTTMIGRSKERVSEKMEQLGLSHFGGPYDLVVNATPVSSGELSEAKGLTEALSGSKVVFDHNMPEKDGKINYLQKYCIENNIYFIPGKDMYAVQMYKQWMLFLDGFTDDNGKEWRVTETDIRRYWRMGNI